MESEKCNNLDRPNKKDRSLSLKNLFDFPFLNENMITWIINTNLYLCKACKCTIIGKDEAYKHADSGLHKQNFIDQKKDSERDSDDAEIKMDMHDEFKVHFYCKKCNICINNDAIMIQAHLLFDFYESLPRSYSDVFQYSFTNNKHYLKCLMCNVLLDSTEMLANHLANLQHIQNIDLLHNIERYLLPHIDWDRLNLETMENESQLMPYSFKSRNYMLIEGENSKSAIWIDLHNRQSERRFSHEINPSEKLEIEKNFKKALNYDFYVCHLCDQRFYTLDLILKHYKNWKHKLFLFIINDPDCDLLQTLHYSKFIQQLPFKTEKKLQLSQDIEPISDEKIKNTLYQEDVKKFGREYILMCIQRNNCNIYNVDPKQSALLSTGKSLIFTFAAHKVCIPCNYEFRNSAEDMFEHLQCEVHIQNLQTIEKISENSKNKYSFLQLAYCFIGSEDILKNDLNCLKCFACNQVIRNINKDIENHIESNTHKQKQKLVHNQTSYFLKNNKYITKIPKEIWYYAERFFCEVCNVRYNREICFAIHLSESEHLKKVKGNKSKHSLNICYVCSTYWYGVSSYTKHCYSSYHHAHFKRNFHQFINKATKSLLKNFNRELNSLVTSSDEQSRKDELFVLQSIEETVKPVYPSAKAHAFGSRLACLSFSSSDVDVFLDCENIYNSLASQERSQEYIQKLLEDCIEKEEEMWNLRHVRLKSRVPIIKLTHIPTGLECDISFLNGLGVEKSKLIRSYVIANPACQKLILYLKKWFQSCKLYGTYAMSGYAVTWLSIFYLQIKRIVPSVHELLNQNEKLVFVDGWPCNFSNQVLLKDTKITLIDIVKGFFEYFAEFDYCRQVACPLLGKIMKKQAFVIINDLPSEMNSYKERMEVIDTEHFRYDSPMVIQDPVDLSQNITKAVTKTQIRQFRYLCSVSSGILN